MDKPDIQKMTAQIQIGIFRPLLNLKDLVISIVNIHGFRITAVLQDNININIQTMKPIQ